MLYILESQETVNLQPELRIDGKAYGSGFTMPIKKGFFLFDTNKTTQHYWESDETIEIDGISYHVDINRKFNNPVKAKIVFLKLKIDEAQKSKFDYFFPNSYQKLVDEFNELIEQKPEYAI